jgi:Ser/Thr protein kinase RdoA (MazF antagonist)
MMAARMKANGKEMPTLRKPTQLPSWEIEKRKKQAAVRGQKNHDLQAKMHLEEVKVRTC